MFRCHEKLSSKTTAVAVGLGTSCGDGYHAVDDTTNASKANDTIILSSWPLMNPAHMDSG